MAEKVIKTIPHPNGTQRVLIVGRDSGFFGFEEEYFSSEPLEVAWVRLPQKSFSICDSPEGAEREARGRIKWLAELS